MSDSASQASITEQLAEAISLCNREGLYGAADWLRRTVQRQRVEDADCRRCETEALLASSDFIMGRMIVCSLCGDKRCPRADDHDNACASG